MSVDVEQVGLFPELDCPDFVAPAHAAGGRLGTRFGHFVSMPRNSTPASESVSDSFPSSSSSLMVTSKRLKLERNVF